MNKRGFTLVELLAVIIILSLLALLTSTAVTNLVKDSRNDLSSTQMELIKSAAQTWGADNLTGLPADGECSYLTLVNLKDYGLIDSNIKDPNTNEKISDDLKIKISTTKNQNSGKLITTYEVNPQSVDGCYKQVYNNGEVVYFDVTTGKSCTNYNESQSATGVKSGCMKFYAFLDRGRKLNLLLDHNTTDVTGYDREEIFETLMSDTSSWLGTETPQSYTSIKGKYTIDYSEYKARLITAQEVAKITGKYDWNEDARLEDRYYFDSLSKIESDTCKEGNITGCKYGWLYDRTSTDCELYGCLNNAESSNHYMDAYWTSTFSSSFKSTGDEGYVEFENPWYINCTGGISHISMGDIDGGVRPVIEVLKSNLQ